MKFSYNWLKELSGTKKSPSELAEFLALRAFEVEGIEKIGGGLDKIIVAKILETEKHPKADKLSLVKLAIGNSQFVNVVCGATNIKVGDIVPLALPGAKLPSGVEIKEAEIRGVKSSGMLCAEDELGLGDDHSGIFILDKSLKIGKLLKDELGLEDTILDIKVTANRGHDALSHSGMAREICAIEGRVYTEAKLLFRSLASKNIAVLVKDKKLCPRYIGAVMSNIKIAPSPMWMQARLRTVGIRPINNIVDATNYVMLETGQPMHVFDVDKIKMQNAKINIIVRRAAEGEEIKLLDGIVKKLTSEDLVIANDKKTLAIAGIMGGKESGISENTTNIVLEAANFDAQNIRKSRIRLGLKTESSDRFERELDPNLAQKAMALAIQIIEQWGGKTEKVVDVYRLKIKPRKINLSLDYVNNFLGTKIPPFRVKNILSSLGIKSKNHEVKKLKVTAENSKSKFISCEIPTWRIDLCTQEDLIEEIGRIYGYEKIEAKAPQVTVKMPVANENRQFERLIKNILSGQGFSEVYNYSFYSQPDANLANLGNLKHLELENPANSEQALLRVSLIPGIINNLRENLKRQNDILIFEIGRVYWVRNGGEPLEKRFLVGAVVIDEKRNDSDKRFRHNFYAAKGFCDILLEKLGCSDFYYDSFEPVPVDTPLGLWHLGRSAAIKIEDKGQTIGYVGEVNPLVLVNFDVHRRAALFEFDLDKLQSHAEQEREFEPLQKFPEAIRDISLIAPGGILVDEILQVIQKAGGNLVIDVDLFDIYDFADGSSSYAFHIVFGAPDRTLEGGEIEKNMKEIIDALEKKLKVKVRK